MSKTLALIETNLRGDISAAGQSVLNREATDKELAGLIPSMRDRELFHYLALFGKIGIIWYHRVAAHNLPLKSANMLALDIKLN